MPQPKLLKYKSVKAGPNFKLGRLDHYVKAHSEPQKEQAFRVIEGLFLDVAKERHENYVVWDLEKIKKSNLVTITKDGKLVIVKNRSNPKNVHTHPGKNRTIALPSIKDIRELYMDYIKGIFTKAPKLQENTSWIIGQDIANNNVVTGKTIVYIPKKIQNQLRKKYSMFELDGKLQVKVSEKNGKFYSIPYIDFTKQIYNHFESLDKRIHENIIAKLNTQKLSSEQKLAEYQKEYLYRLQKLFNLKLEFHANPGYKLNEDNFFFERK